MNAVKKFSKEKMKQARKDKNLTLRDAAGMLEKEGAKIKYNTLSQYEDNRKPNTPNANDMPVICMVYDKPMDYFYEDPEDKNKSQKTKNKK